MSDFSANLKVLQKLKDKLSSRIHRDFEELTHLQTSVKSTIDFANMSCKKIEAIIIEELMQARPNFDLFSSVSGEVINEKQKYRWVINCISDIQNYAHALPFSTIAISVEENNGSEFTTIVSMVIILGSNETFYAEKNKGAWVEVSQGNVVNSRIRVSSRPKDFLIITDSSEERQLLNFNSKIIPLVYLASGRIDGVHLRDLSHFDISASILLIVEAGGYIKKKKEGDLYSVIATNYKSDKLLPKSL